MKATIGIITCRRHDGLKRLLDALQKQVIADETELDVLVVDNACESAVRDIVKESSDQGNYGVQYCEEPEPGIPAARNKCVEAFLKSKSNFLIFIDDDEWPMDDSWVQNMLNAQKKYDADIITSRVESVADQGVPKWAVQLIYGKSLIQDGSKVNIFYTNNLLVLRDVLKHLSPAFDQRFAMTGASDYHFALKSRKAGFQAYYIDAPVCETFPKSRANVAWLMRRGYRSGVGYARSHLFEDEIIAGVLLSVCMSCLRLLRGVLLLLVGLLTLSRLRIVSGLFRLSSGIGTLAGLIGLKYNEYGEVRGQKAAARK